MALIFIAAAAGAALAGCTVRMPIDNNLLAHDIRVFATESKSWLLCDTVGGARAGAVTYSLMLTFRACGVAPLAWLRHSLTELPSDLMTPNFDDLLPFNFERHA